MVNLFRKILSILLVVFFCIGTVVQTITVISFYSFRKEIAAQNCINKNRPELHCKGQCQLNKLIKPIKTTDSNQEDTCERGLLLFAAEEIDSLKILDSISGQNNVISYKGLSSEKHSDKLEFPPDLLKILI